MSWEEVRINLRVNCLVVKMLKGNIFIKDIAREQGIVKIGDDSDVCFWVDVAEIEPFQ